MTHLFFPNRGVWTLLGASIVLPALGQPALADSFSPDPIYTEVLTYSTQLPTAEGEPSSVDIYYPSGATALPTALLLQGALVDQDDYSNFARIVASYGFSVVVPNNVRAVANPESGEAFPGLFSQQEQIQSTLDFVAAENQNPDSPLEGLLDPGKLVLLGHSFGGAVGLAAIWGDCVPLLCASGTYERPEALLGGAFYGTPFADPRLDGGVPAIDNASLPVALVAGDLDGVAALPDVEATYAQIQDPPKALITLVGANHYGITNQDNPARDSSTPTLDQAVATETIARWSALFLRGTALGDEAALNYIFETGDDADPNVTVVGEPQLVPEPALP